MYGLFSVFISVSLKVQFENEKFQSKNNLNFLQLYGSVCVCVCVCVCMYTKVEKEGEKRKGCEDTETGRIYM